MSRSFDGTAGSSATVTDIHAAFGREDYWVARLAPGDAVTTLDALVVTDTSMTVRYTQHLGRQLLPGAVARLVPGEVRMEYTESWTPDDDGRVRGRIDVTVSGGLGSCTSAAWLEPAGSGSRLRFDGSVKVRIPVVGGGLEKAIAADLTRNIPSVMDFTTTWIAENA